MLRPRLLPPPYRRRGETWGGSRPVRGGQAGTLARCECEVKFPGNWCPRPLSPPTRDVVKFGVVRGPSSNHSDLGLTPKLILSVIVAPACAADMETAPMSTAPMYLIQEAKLEYLEAEHSCKFV